MRNRTPDIQATYNVDLRKNLLDNKCVDLVLMIDVIEHIPDSDKALNEVGRIGKFAVFNIPLEKNFIEFVWKSYLMGHYDDQKLQLLDTSISTLIFCP